MSSYPSGFGVLALYPGIVENPPAFSFYRTGVEGTLDHYIQDSTGNSRIVYSLYSGDNPPLDFSSGIGNSFHFDEGVMSFGGFPAAANRPDSGNLGIFWNGADSSPTHAGLMITQTSAAANSGSPNIVIRTEANAGGFGLEVNNYLGTYAENKSDYGTNTFRNTHFPAAMSYHSANVFADSSYTIPENGGAVDYFDGFGWGMWDGTDKLYTNLALHKDYAEIGHFEQKSTRQNLGGVGALVIRNAAINPSTYHTSGTTLFSSGDGSFNIRTSSGKSIQLGPGIEGINRLKYSNEIFSVLTYDGGGVAALDSSHDGKIVISNPNIDGYTIEADVSNGFSCEVINMGVAKFGHFDTVGGSIYGVTAIDGNYNRSFVNKYSGDLYVSSTPPRQERIYVPASQFYPTITSGAGTGMFETPVYKATYKTIDYDHTTPMNAEAEVLVPSPWSKIGCEINFTNLSGTPGTSVVWRVSYKYDGVDGEQADNAFSSPVIATHGTAGSGIFNVAIPPLTATPVGTIPTVGEKLVKIRIQREAANVNDDLAATAKLLGVSITNF